MTYYLCQLWHKCGVWGKSGTCIFTDDWIDMRTEEERVLFVERRRSCGCHESKHEIVRSLVKNI